jgi:hypothetical protein
MQCNPRWRLALSLSLSLSASSGFRDTHHAAEEVSNSNSE